MKAISICDLLGIQFPLIQGGMAWVADAQLAAAVSNGGGLGLIAAGSMTPEQVRTEIARTRKLTARPFGVNIMLMSPYAEAVAELVREERVDVVTTGAGSPGKYIEGWKAAGIKVVPVVASVAQARRMQSLGADAIIGEGTEAGGHIGESTTLVLVPQLADAVSIPVVAAGGIADGRGIAAAMILGAAGVQVGTRFLACSECAIHDNYKAMVVKARDIDTTVTGRSGGHPVRTLKNKLSRRLVDLEKSGATFEEIEEITIGSLRKAVQDGNLEEGSFMAGQSAGLIRNILPAADIIREMFIQAQGLLGGRLPVAVPGLDLAAVSVGGTK